MGVEILGGVILWLVILVGFFGSVVLLGLSLTPSSRPYAVGAFIAAMVFTALSSRSQSHSDVFFGVLVSRYSFGVVVFGASAYAINRLVERKRKRSLRPNKSLEGQ
jgi:hypothetical protein